MNPARLASRHARAVLFFTGLLAAAGFLVGRSLPSDIYPPLSFPRVVVVGHAGTLPARSMMLSVTRPIEQVVMEVPGIRRVRSKTFRGATEISAQFDPATDILQALQQVQNRVAELRSELPAEADLTVERLTTATFPILSYNLTGGLPEAKLHDFAFYVMRPALGVCPGRPGGGGLQRHAGDRGRRGPGASAGQQSHGRRRVRGLKAANRVTPVARYSQGGLQSLVLASGLWRSQADIGNTPVLVKDGAAVRVADVAAVVEGAPDRLMLVTGNGEPAAVISVSQQIGSNILDVRAGVEDALHDLAHSLPSGCTSPRCTTSRASWPMPCPA
jgi:multidrug efflux pump subunit AcrB